MSRNKCNLSKAELIRRVHQQRRDLRAASSQWLDATERFDHGWLSLRRLILLGGGVLAFRAVRKPRRMLRWVQRTFGLLSAVRLVTRFLRSR